MFVLVLRSRDNLFLRGGTEGGFTATVYWWFELLIFKDPEVNRSQKVNSWYQPVQGPVSGTRLELFLRQS